MIVEDEFIIALSATELVRSAGFKTVEVRNADEAVAVLESRSDISVVFTDVRMPGHRIVREGELPEGGLFIAKRYANRAVTDALATLTDPHRQGSRLYAH